MPSRLGVTAVLALLLACAGSSPAPAARLTVLHTNDTHSHLMPFSYPDERSGASASDSTLVRRDIGGIARRATLVRTIREQCRLRGEAVLLIDAGDICDGTSFSTEYHGDADLAAMRAAGYDFLTLGNHDFSNTPEQVRSLVASRRAAGAAPRVLLANVLENDGTPITTPYAMLALDSLRIGLFGLTTESSAGYPAARQAFQVLPVTTTARAVSSALREMGADLVVLISHCGVEVDRELAGIAPTLDVIVGGHSHSRLPAGEYFRPFEASPSDSNGTIIVQAHQWGGELGRLDLDLSRDAAGQWRIARHNAELLPITSALTPDAGVAAIVDSFWAPIAPKYGEAVGEATDDFSSRRQPDGTWDQANYNLVADAIRETYDTQIEMENLGGVRAPLLRGPITFGDLVMLDPFDNTIVTYHLTGRDLKRILVEHGPAVSGLTYRIEGGKLVEVEVGGKPVRDDAVYTGASNSYFAPRALKGIEYTDTGRPRLEVLREYVRSKKVISPRYDGRRRVRED
jgi:2',3'-cyclic-nucleotide 2'-phosphodiesterase (5'-nucleotidase family)